MIWTKRIFTAERAESVEKIIAKRLKFWEPSTSFPALKGAPGKDVIPAKAGIQLFEFVNVLKCLDARFRGHDG
jgi:hypothetical protein